MSNDVISITDIHGDKHFMLRSMVSEIATSDNGVVIYVCGHPITVPYNFDSVVNKFFPS